MNKLEPFAQVCFDLSLSISFGFWQQDFQAGLFCFIAMQVIRDLIK